MTRLWRKIKFRPGRKAPPPGALAHARDTPAKPRNHSMSASPNDFAVSWKSLQFGCVKPAGE